MCRGGVPFTLTKPGECLPLCRRMEGRIASWAWPSPVRCLSNHRQLHCSADDRDRLSRAPGPQSPASGAAAPSIQGLSLQPPGPQPPASGAAAPSIRGRSPQHSGPQPPAFGAAASSLRGRSPNHPGPQPPASWAAAQPSGDRLSPEVHCHTPLALTPKGKGHSGCV